MCISLNTLDRSPIIDEIIIVTGRDDMEYMKDVILRDHPAGKVTGVIPGGSERYLSVWEGLKACRERTDYSPDDIIFIQDSARPFISDDILDRCLNAVHKTGACVAGMPSKDTIRLSDASGMAADTIPRERVWIMQTPQVFRMDLIYPAFEALMEMDEDDPVRLGITDDVMVLQSHDPEAKVSLVEGSYKNIKVTTRDDLAIAAAFLEK